MSQFVKEVTEHVDDLVRKCVIICVDGAVDSLLPDVALMEVF